MLDPNKPIIQMNFGKRARRNAFGVFKTYNIGTYWETIEQYIKSKFGIFPSIYISYDEFDSNILSVYIGAFNANVRIEDEQDLISTTNSIIKLVGSLLLEDFSSKSLDDIRTNVLELISRQQYDNAMKSLNQLYFNSKLMGNRDYMVESLIRNSAIST